MICFRSIFFIFCTTFFSFVIDFMGRYVMKFMIGDIVTRKSHDNDILFKIIEIDNSKALLKGIDVRLVADSDLDDLVKMVDTDQNKLHQEDTTLTKRAISSLDLDRSEYFYLPGKILHIDADNDYLQRCIKFYRDVKVEAYGINLKEDEVSNEIINTLNTYKPNIVVITGHDAYFKNRDEKYQNSDFFIHAVRKAREYEQSQDKLIIIAGACQSNYEELIKAGANFASSPKRVNIHALDPAIVASSIAFSPKNKEIDLIPLLEKTKYGTDGMGGIITNGTMYVGFPR